MENVDIAAMPPERFNSLLGERAAEWSDALTRARETLGGHTLWHINSTSKGGGVAEMLQSVLCYLIGAGVDTRWLVVEGGDDFFALTKQIHFLLHGEPGDSNGLGRGARRTYDSALESETSDVLDLVRAGDTVILHDPQTLGLAPALSRAGAVVIWSCHVGSDTPNEHTRLAWRFLLPYAQHTLAQGFSRAEYVWEGLEGPGAVVIPPCIDAFSPKNQDLESDVVSAILDRSSLIGGERSGTVPEFIRGDGSRGTVSLQAKLVEDRPLPADAPIVTQISRWDPLKDHAGVMTAFAHHVAAGLGAHLVLAGPDPEAIADDPGACETFAGLRREWWHLPRRARERVHIACLPMSDLEENAAIVNALQRRSDVIVQKSLAEGFGLTVTEGMWKAKPIIGTRIGGIQDQIVHRSTGLLIDDASDLPALGRAITETLEDPAAAEMGRAARQRVIDEYVVPCYVTRYLRLAETVAASSAA
jgi:trehalose synthase